MERTGMTGNAALGASPDATTGGIAVGQANRPTDFVAAALPHGDAFEAAFAELVRAGVAADTIAVLLGDRGAAAITEARRHARGWLDMSDQGRYVERFEDEARDGHYVVGVPLPGGDPALRRSVAEILARHGGHTLVNSTRWTHDISG